jgi:Na+(H+)/acetate symporter ActP
VRFYTNPDGRAARRTTLVVIALLGVFYVWPPVYALLGRHYAPDLVANGAADTVVLVLPERMVGGFPGQLLGALVTAGAFAAFLSTASGLTVSIAGVAAQDFLHGGVRAFRVAAVVAAGVPAVLAVFVGQSIDLASAVGLAFAVAASTFCPLLVLGIWWPRLTVAGALSGLIVGSVSALVAVVVTYLGVAGPGWTAALFAEPAAWTVPLAFLTSVTVSLVTPAGVPRDSPLSFLRLHAPEQLLSADSHV